MTLWLGHVVRVWRVVVATHENHAHSESAHHLGLLGRRVLLHGSVDQMLWLVVLLMWLIVVIMWLLNMWLMSGWVGAEVGADGCSCSHTTLAWRIGADDLG